MPPGRMSARHVLGATAVFAVASVAVNARAQAPLTLEWQAPDGCPTGPSVTRAVEKLITEPPGRVLEASATITKLGERWAAEIRTPRGERRLDGESCRAVAEAVAMVLALAIDPNASPNAAAFAAFDEPDSPAPESPPSAERAPAPRAPAAASSSPSRPSDRAASPTETSRERDDDAPGVIAALFAVGELGMLPQPTLGAALGVGVGAGAWSAEVGPMLLIPRSGSLENDTSRGGEIGYIGGYAAGCLAPFRSRRFDVCGAFEVGRIAGTGFGVTDPLPGEALWLAPALFGAMRVPVAGSFGGEGRLVLAAPLHRPTFELDALGAVHRPAPFSVRGELGFSWR
jgi:hypothetical protein